MFHQEHFPDVAVQIEMMMQVPKRYPTPSQHSSFLILPRHPQQMQKHLRTFVSTTEMTSPPLLPLHMH
jgi:hypothetical protein